LGTVRNRREKGENVEIYGMGAFARKGGTGGQKSEQNGREPNGSHLEHSQEGEGGQNLLRTKRRAKNTFGPGSKMGTAPS